MCLKKNLFTAILFFIFFAVFVNAQNKADIRSIVEEVKKKHIQDSRQAVYDVSINTSDSIIYLSGGTTDEQAYKELLQSLKETGKRVNLDKFKLLPYYGLKDTLYGVINVSVADIRTQNRFTSGMATQALLGTPIRLYEHDSWYRIQLPDSYFGWAHEKQIVPMNKEEYNKWLLAPKVIFTNHYGFAYLNPNNEGPIVSDLVKGAVLKFEGISGDYFKVIYPDGRKGYVLRSESREYALWFQSVKPTTKSFVEAAKKMMGIPYVWGGTSTKGFDCSGLVSSVMYLHGLIILRDASQQAFVGEPVDISEGYDNLQEGDLMFFGKKAVGDQEESIRHVGFYLGDMKFIHASGWVRINSLDPDDEDYDELNTREFVKATRVISNGKLIGVEKIKDNNFYHIQ